MISIVHVITGLEDGGAESSLYRLCTNTPYFNHHVISLRGHGKYGPLLESAGIKVESLGLNRRNFIKSFLSLVLLLSELKPDIVQTWMYHADFLGGLSAKIANRSSLVVWNLRRSSLDPSNSRLSTIALSRLLSILSYLVPAKIVACSNKAVEYHIRTGYHRHRMVYIPNGCDISRFKPNPALGKRFIATLKINNSVPLIGLVARFHPAKDHKTLFESLSLLVKGGVRFKLVLVGTGMNYRNAALVSLINQNDLGNCIYLVDSYEDIPAVMNAINIHVLSSSTEGFPNVVCEAMACGTPCVVTDVGDAKHIVGSTGWIASKKDPVSLANSIQKAIACIDTAGWSSICNAAQERILQNYSLSNMTSAYETLWLSLIATREAELCNE